MKHFVAVILSCAAALVVATPSSATGLTGIATLSASFAHTCAVTHDGVVKCWGRGNFGQLGDGSGLSHPYAVETANIASGARGVSVGEFFSCAVMNTGGVKCWGQNYIGQLGDNTTLTRLTPVDVKGLSSAATAIAVGSAHACALLASGRVQCWGLNQKGQLGDGTTADRRLPVDVIGLSGVVAISAGAFHTCAVTIAATVACWGYNDFGQLGDNTRVTSTVPVVASGLNGVSSISAGYGHTCAIVANSRPKCWGLNDAGQLGDGTKVGRLVPTDVVSVGSAVRIAAGKTNTCAITGSQAVACWGSNLSGESSIGNGSVPEKAIAVAVGWSHACAVGQSGAVYCSGLNEDGRVGAGGSTIEMAPVPVIGLDASILSIATGGSYTCALNAAGGVLCWGGVPRIDGGRDPVLVPTTVPGLSSGVVSMAAGSGFTCALTIAGGVKCWGANTNGQLGNGAFETFARAVPVDVIGLESGIAAIDAGGAHACAITNGGSVKCWGSNSSGQIGDGTPTARPIAVDITGFPSRVTAISTGGNHTCAVTANGAAYCWGSNSAGQLGDGTVLSRSTPQLVLASDVRAIAAGGLHTCAILASGPVRCWGANYTGQLGNGTMSSTGVANVVGLANATALSAGFDYTCALTSIGRMQCWGAASSGKLGDNAQAISRMVPVFVVGLAPGIRSIGTGDFHTCAVTADNRALCWGSSFVGQVGNRASSQYTNAVAVVNAPDVRVNEFYNADLDAYFITADLYEGYAVDLGGAGPGWVRTGGSFRAGGNTPVCRFYGSVSPGPNSHFYTVDPFECDVLRARQFAANDPRRLTEKGWNFESYDFRSTPAANGFCPAGTEPIYRAYNNGSVRGIDSNHRFTRDTNAIGDLVRRGWISEGVKMCAPV